ncbi:MAG: SGNH/GDSL hydrolase family protein [Bdellovibrionales bacterium]|nr:SGNH/GDSL hydrolase family protein [Bdellovibrionales bacterium]
MFRIPKLYAVTLLAVGTLISRSALACPMFEGLADYNCDQMVKITFLGDSIVRGVGDSSVKRGGYVGRIAEGYFEDRIVNMGVPGITSNTMFTNLRRNLKRANPGKTVRKLRQADRVVLHLGVNDYWLDRGPRFTIRNLKRIVKLLRKEMRDQYGAKPLISVSTLLPTARSYQAPFVDAVNAEIKAADSSALPVQIVHDDFDLNLLTDDGLHPGPIGYDNLADKVGKFIRNRANNESQEAHTDTDLDGVYDFYETHRFGTSITLSDSDGDGVLDGAEIFENNTDPLDASDF